MPSDILANDANDTGRINKGTGMQKPTTFAVACLMIGKSINRAQNNILRHITRHDGADLVHRNRIKRLHSAEPAS